MTLVQKLRELGGAAGGPNIHDDAADRINELEVLITDFARAIGEALILRSAAGKHDES